MDHIGDPAVAEAAHMDPEEDGWKTMRRYLTSPVGQTHVRRTFYHLTRKFLEAREPDAHQQYIRWSKMEKEFDQDAFVLSKLATLMMPSFASDALATAKAHDRRRLADAALWVLEQSHKTGKRPDSLPSDARFRDFWTNKPFVFVWNESDFYVRSVGPNKIDDGDPSSAEDSKSDDVEIKVVKPD